MTTPRQEKERLERKYEELRTAYRNGEITKQTYLDKQHELFDGKFPEDRLAELDDQADTNTTRALAISASVLSVLALIFLLQGPITGLITADPVNASTLTIDQALTTNTSLNYSFITADSLRANGRIYGHGETWIYLVHNGTRQLVSYTDTRDTNAATGNVVKPPAVAMHNTSTPSDVSRTAVMNTSDNTTSSDDINTSHDVNATDNTTQGDAATTATNTTQSNTTTNDVNTTNTTVDTIPTINLTVDNDEYTIGDTVNITITPNTSSYTLYMYTPTDTYILDEPRFNVTETGTYEAVALITADNITDRREAEFNVYTQEPTATLDQACVETCTIPPGNVTIEIVTKGTKLVLDNVTYTAASTTSTPDDTTNDTTTETTNTTTNETTNETSTESTTDETTTTPLNQTKDVCGRSNPNQQPVFCLYQNTSKYFTDQDIILRNLDRQPVAQFTPIGNLLIGGTIIENSTAQPGSRDFRIGYVTRDGVSQTTIWIDNDNGDLHLRGTLNEANTNLNPPRGSYSVSNSRGVYLAYADQDQGDLYIRGNVIPGRYRR